MWKRFYGSTFLICLLLVAADARSQERVRASILSLQSTSFAGSPRLAHNDDDTWVAAWRQADQPATILARVIGPLFGPGPVKRLAPGIAEVDDAFDLIFIPRLQIFWVAYDTPAGLRLQRLTKDLLPSGTSTAIDNAGQGGRPRWIYDRARDRLSLFWIASASGSQSLRFMTIQGDGSTIVGRRFVYNAPPGSTITLVNPALNERNGLIVCLFALQDQGATELKAVRVTSAGALLPSVSVAHYEGLVKLNAAAAFSNRSGQGFAAWTAGESILRTTLITPTGSFGSPAREMPGENHATSVSAYFDFKNNRFVAVWTSSRQIRIAAFHPQSGGLTLAPSVLATSAGEAMHVQSSYHNSLGFAISAWEEFEGGVYRIRSATFQIRTRQLVLQGRIKDQKFYNPPILNHGVKYYVKYRVLSGGKQYLAYLTSETEVIGAQPVEGDWIRMKFEPSRTRYRGYIEEIRVIPQP